MYVKLKLFLGNWEKGIGKDYRTPARSFKGKWDNSGATENTLACHGQFNWIHQKTILKDGDKTIIKKKTWEALETKIAKRRLKITVLSRDEGNLVKTNT